MFYFTKISLEDFLHMKKCANVPNKWWVKTDILCDWTQSGSDFYKVRNIFWYVIMSGICKQTKQNFTLWL